MLDWLANIDESIFLFLHHLTRCELMDSFMWMISNTYVWIPLYVAIVWWLFLRFGWKKRAVIIIAIVLATVCSDQTCATIIRPAVERLRPTHPDNPLSWYVSTVNDYRGAFGFPSCHAANTFMLATFIFLLSRNWALFTSLIFWAAANCVSRIYLGVHYPGDILFGALVGMSFAVVWRFAATYFCARLLNRRLRRIGQSKADLLPIWTVFSVFAILIAISILIS